MHGRSCAHCRALTAAGGQADEARALELQQLRQAEAEEERRRELLAKQKVLQ